MSNLGRLVERNLNNETALHFKQDLEGLKEPRLSGSRLLGHDAVLETRREKYALQFGSKEKLESFTVAAKRITAVDQPTVRNGWKQRLLRCQLSTPETSPYPLDLLLRDRQPPHLKPVSQTMECL